MNNQKVYYSWMKMVDVGSLTWKLFPCDFLWGDVGFDTRYHSQVEWVVMAFAISLGIVSHQSPNFWSSAIQGKRQRADLKCLRFVELERTGADE